MSSSHPQIGFDRFISLDWAATALSIRAGTASLEDLEAKLDASYSGIAAKKKTRTVLNRLWLDPRADLINFADRGVELYRNDPKNSVPVLTWGMALSTYPFFGKVAEIVGRLTTLQGSCTSVEVHRRMAELYGEREGTRRMTNMVLQSQADWGAIARTDKGKRIEVKQPIDLGELPVATWIAEACLRYTDRALMVASLASHPALFPFNLGASIAYLLSQSRTVEVHRDSASNQIATLVDIMDDGTEWLINP